MEEYIQRFNKGKSIPKKYPTNPVYSRALRRLGIKVARKVVYSQKMDESYRIMNYVRYGDDFIITIIGSKADAVEIQNKCSEFLNSMKLTLSEEKTLITNPKDKSVAFLGYLIQNSPYKIKIKIKIREYSRISPSIFQIKREPERLIAPGFVGIYLKVDSTLVKLRLHEKGFCKRSGEPIPNFKYLANTQHATIIQMSYILKGLANYYKLANNVRQMVSRWNYILRFSIAKLFAAKYQLHSTAQVYAKAGKDLGKPIKETSLKEKSKVNGQEEKIWEYPKTTGIKQKKKKPIEHIGIPYTLYKTIPNPDIAPLSNKLIPTF
jgi:Type II intron maturase/Reverse transcriptase (RNA-dependent DNA polymerase)